MKRMVTLSVIVIASFLFFNTSVMAVNKSDLNNADNARANYDYAGKIDNWKYFKTNSKGIKLSYEHRYTDLAYPFEYDASMSQEAITESPEIYIYNDVPGYLFFYVKAEPTEEMRNDITKELHKDNRYKLSWDEIHKNDKTKMAWDNVEFGYIVSWYRISCEKEIVETKENYYYSNTNDYILWTKGTSTSTPPKLDEFTSNKIPLFSTIPLHTMCASFNKNWELYAKLKRANVEKMVQINELEVNPYEFEGHTIAVVVQFKKMLSKNSASFYSGYTDLENYTNVYDEIIVTGVPSGSHFESGLYAPKMMLVLKGKGTIAGTNAFGAKIKAPHFQWISIISGEQPSTFEEQRDVSRKNALQNMRNGRPSRAQ